MAANDEAVTALVQMASESWRFLRTIERMVQGLDGNQQRRIASHISYFQRKLADSLETAQLKLVVFDGSEFGPSIAATAINASEFGPNDVLVVDCTLEPAILGPDGLLRTGTVTLRKLGS